MSMTFSRQHKKLFKLEYIIFLIFLRFCMFLPIRKLFCLMVNHGAGDIRVWPFLDNIKMLSKLEYIIFLIFLRFCMFYPSGNFFVLWISISIYTLSFTSFTLFQSWHIHTFGQGTFVHPLEQVHTSWITSCLYPLVYNVFVPLRLWIVRTFSLTTQPSNVNYTFFI